MRQRTEAGKIGKYLKKKREEMGMSFREAARAAGVSHTHIMEIEAGKKSATFEKMMRILGAYNTNVDQLLEETDYLPANVTPIHYIRLRKVPIISWSAASGWMKRDAAFRSQDAVDWFRTTAKGPHLFALYVKGDSMAPEFKERDIIVVNPNRRAGAGKYVIAVNGKDEATLRQYRKIGKTAVLHALNPRYKDITLKKDLGYRIVGVVAEKSTSYEVVV
jgi:SOS-response transcriptional repressor LexA